MKRIFLFFLFFCCFLSISMKADEIDMRGSFAADTSRSLIVPVQVFITDQFLEVDFNTSLGVIDLSIYDDEGNVVYQQIMVA